MQSNSRLQRRSKVMQGGEGGSEDEQLCISDVPYPNMARGHRKVHLMKGLETP